MADRNIADRVRQPRALRLAEGHIDVYVDYKEAAPDAIVAAIDGADMGERVVIYGDPDR
jgi:hypothetical protein